MKLPIILVIDDDQQVLRAITRDLRSTYGKEYKIMSTDSAKEAFETVKVLKQKNEVVALFLSDQRMPEMSGVEFLKQVSTYFPKAKRVLLTAYSDIDAAIKAINDVHLDYYLAKPWDPPEEKLYPVLNELLEDWHAHYKPCFEGIKVVGYQWSPHSHRVKDFLSGNLVPYLWLDMHSTQGKELIERNNLVAKDLPAIFFEDGSMLANPELVPLAEKIGMKPQASDKVYDVVIIGAGPAGLAAAVYGASEGLKTLLIEKHAPGGQAGTSSRIENYLGFPSGLSGAELTRRAITQATRLGAEFLAPAEVTDMKMKDNYKILTTSSGAEIRTKSIIITTGVDYRHLEATGIERLTGAGVYYGAATTEAHACTGKEVYIVGGGNSAGQASMYLSNFASHVYIVIRKDDLTATMSQYLIDQIAATPNIELIPNTEVVEAIGEERLEAVMLEDSATKEHRQVPADALYIFIGVKPITNWIKLNILKNDKGFVETGRDLMKYDTFKGSWKLDREPFMLETCTPGIFAAGDVRAGAMNRIASAVGEGAMAIKFVHEYLAG